MSDPKPVPVRLSVTEAMDAALRTFAERHDTSVSQVIRWAIRDFLKGRK